MRRQVEAVSRRIPTLGYTVNDAARAVNVAVDARLLAPASQPLWFHPLHNEASVALSATDLLKLLAHTGHAHTVVDFSA